MANLSQSPSPALPPNFYDPKPLGNHHSTVFGVCITLLGLCWITGTFRLWTRFRITKTPGWDDLFVVLSIIVITMGTVAFCVATRYGLGEHIYLIDLKNLPSFLKCHYIVGASYTSSTALIKISLLFQYLRLFERGCFTYRLTQLILVLVVMWGIGYSFSSWLCCLPKPSAFWNLTSKGCYGFAAPKADDAIKFIKGHAAVNMGLDFIILTLPVGLLFKEKTPSKTKKGLLVLLFIGCIITAFSVWRLQSIIKTDAGFKPVLDPTWNEPAPTLISFVEVYVAAICASTPVFWPVLEAQITKIFVSYEFNVSSESRYRVEDEVELAHTQSWPAGSKSGSSKVDTRSVESRSGDTESVYRPKQSQYTDDFIQSQVNPLADEFRAEATVKTGTTHKKKKSIVPFGKRQSHEVSRR